MKRVSPWRIGIGLCIALGLFTVKPGYAEEKKHEPMCTLKTLKGRYLFADKGTILPPAFGVTEPTPGADAGFHLFHGDGTGQDIVTVRINGETVLKNHVFPLTYQVNEDCTGSVSVDPTGNPPGPSFNIFIAPNGESIAEIAADVGNYVSAISQRVSSK